MFGLLSKNSFLTNFMLPLLSIISYCFTISGNNVTAGKDRLLLKISNYHQVNKCHPVTPTLNWPKVPNRLVPNISGPLFQ